MSTMFKDWFCLNNRETFSIDPKVNPSDARFYFGRDPLRERMQKQISRAFIDPQVPKIMFYGAYGPEKRRRFTIWPTSYEPMRRRPARGSHMRCILISRYRVNPWPNSGICR